MCDENSSNAFAREFMLDMQKEFTRFIEDYVLDWNRRLSNLEYELGIENNSIISSHSEQTNLLLRSEASALDRKSKPDGLTQQVLHLQVELSEANAKIKVLECIKNTEESFIRNLVEKKLDTVLEEKVKSCVVKNFEKLVQEMSADATPNRDMQRGISRSSAFTTWSREERSLDESEERKVLELDFVRATVGQAQHTVSTRTVDELKSLEGRIEGDTGENTNRDMQHTVSTRTVDKLKSLEGRIEGDTGENTNRDMQHTVSTRTVDKLKSLEGRIEGDTDTNTNRDMQHTVSTRTIDQLKSLEGRIEGDTGKNVNSDMQHTVSTRTIGQLNSLEGRLERDNNENIPGEMQPAISTRNPDQSLKGDKAEAVCETKHPVHEKNSGAKSKGFGFFQKKKSSKVPDTGDSDIPEGAETGPSGASKAKESSKGKKS